MTSYNERATQRKLLAVIVFALFLLNSAAASKESADVNREPDERLLAGTLKGKGLIRVNGNVVRPGITILSNSTIATGADGIAQIDLGPLGLIELRPDTQIMIVLSSSGTHMRGECNRIRFTVTRGLLLVRLAKSTQILKPNEEATFKGPIETDAELGSYIIVSCSQTPPAAYLVSLPFGAWGAVGAAVGVVSGKGEKPQQRRASNTIP